MCVHVCVRVLCVYANMENKTWRCECAPFFLLFYLPFCQSLLLSFSLSSRVSHLCMYWMRKSSLYILNCVFCVLYIFEHDSSLCCCTIREHIARIHFVSLRPAIFRCMCRANVKTYLCIITTKTATKILHIYIQTHNSTHTQPKRCYFVWKSPHRKYILARISRFYFVPYSLIHIP